MLLFLVCCSAAGLGCFPIATNRPLQSNNKLMTPFSLPGPATRGGGLLLRRTYATSEGAYPGSAAAPGSSCASAGAAASGAVAMALGDAEEAVARMAQAVIGRKLEYKVGIGDLSVS